MHAVATKFDEQQKADAVACLARVAADPIFAHAKRQKRFLRYLVDAALAGRGTALKGYTIGVDVFDRRPQSFDPTVDAIVRVQAGNLRAKLREYYGDLGRGDPVRFELPKGKSCTTRIAGST